MQAASLSVWAKSSTSERGEVTHWLPLVQHCDDAEGIARLLLERWVAPQVVRRLRREIPGGAISVQNLAGWLASVHDIGKCSIAFSAKVPVLANAMNASGLRYTPDALVDTDARRKTVHSFVGNIVVRDWLADELGLPYHSIAAQLASIVGSHHGVAPESAQLTFVREHGDLVGTNEWAKARGELLERATERAGGRSFLQAFGEISLSRPSQVLLSAIVIIADWIASNTDLFPLRPISTATETQPEPDDRLTMRRVQRAWKQLNLPTPWQSTTSGQNIDAAFTNRFPHIERARPVQRATVELATAQQGPGLLIIEAPMGVGKTEAALLAAEVLAADSGANGCLIALPTQATTDAMFTRAVEWLRSLPRRPDGTPADVILAHGKASLNDDFAGLVRQGRFTSVCADDDQEGQQLAVHDWLRGRKKGLLASFVISTIDQVLAMGLKSRHVMLRHLALAGKVVVIDEVHAYDIYMSQYLHRVLHWFGTYDVPVVLLSATLPNNRRDELLQAYTSGQNENPTAPAESSYPLALSSRAGARAIPLGNEGIGVKLDHLADDPDTLVAYLREKLRDGGCAAVICNAVTRVQQTADRLAEEFGADNVIVDHARFLSCERARIDRDLVARFGKPSPLNDRRGAKIVVASQVIEQSLDLDFDVLVTDLAPMDLLLQRIGRLHRHQRPRPAPLENAHCAVVGVLDWTGTPVRAVRPSQRVYGEHLLLRTAALIYDRQTITVPQDISALVQRAYSADHIGPASWQPAMSEAAVKAQAEDTKRTMAARTYLLGEATAKGSLTNWLRAGVGDAEGPTGVAQVRDGAENLEVLVVQRDQDGGLTTPRWITDGARQIPLHDEVPFDLARQIAVCSLRLPFAVSHAGVIDQVIGALEKNYVASFARTPLLAGHLVLPLDDRLSVDLVIDNATFRLTYDVHKGLRYERR